MPAASPDALSTGHMVFECQKVWDGGCGYKSSSVRPGTRFVVCASQVLVPHKSKYTEEEGLIARVYVSDMGLSTAMHEAQPYIPRKEIALLRREVWRADRYTESVRGKVHERHLPSGYDPRGMYVRPRIGLEVRDSYRGKVKQTSFWRARYWQTDDIPDRYPVTIRSTEMPDGDLGNVQFFCAWLNASQNYDWIPLSVPTLAISVEPEAVLKWDNNKDRPNSNKRLRYMLGNRAMVKTFSVDDFRDSLTMTSHDFDIAIPAAHIESLVDLVGGYNQELGSRRRIGREVWTGLCYKPPNFRKLDALRNVLQEEHELQVATKAA